MLKLFCFMTKYLNKKLKVVNIDNVFWSSINNNKILVVHLKNNGFLRYIFIPFNINIKKNYFLFVCSYSSKLLNLFFFQIYKWLENFYKPFQVNLYFKGLGFKFKFFNKQKTKLQLKLGYSTPIYVLIPKKQIKIFFFKKNKIAIESFNLFLITNFAYKLRKLKFPDLYNGKGFWYKNEFKILKEIKKT